MNRRKICVVTTSRADYGRMKPVMDAIKRHSLLELQVVAGSSLFLDHFWWYLRHGEPISWWRSISWHVKARGTVLFKPQKEADRLEHLLELLSRDGFTISARLPIFLEGGNLQTMVKTAGLSLLGFPKILEKLSPDIVLTHGDRFEILPVAIGAVFSNVPLAHIEGGDVSGTIDNSVRHAITKLAHIHFPVTTKSRDRLIKTGESPNFIFLAGSPIIDFLKNIDLSLENSLYDIYGPGRGDKIDLTKPFLLVLQHPVTTEYEANYKNTETLIKAIEKINYPVMWVAPNVDAGADGVAEAIREYCDRHPLRIAFFKRFRPEDFCRLLANAAVAVGNSSSFLRESAFLGVPSVIVGDRQQGRERGNNVIEVGYNKEEIVRAIKTQLAHGRYGRDTRFGDGQSSRKIVEVLAGIDLEDVPLQKKFYES